MKGHKKSETILLRLVTRIGFKPMTYCLEGSCSIQLSYRVSFFCEGCKDKGGESLKQKKWAMYKRIIKQ
jgi:hypothetical protein